MPNGFVWVKVLALIQHPATWIYAAGSLLLVKAMMDRHRRDMVLPVLDRPEHSGDRPLLFWPRVFLKYPEIHLLAVAACVPFGFRIASQTPLTVYDLIAVAVVAVAWSPIEWGLHVFVLHSKSRFFSAESHVRHHLNPYSLRSGINPAPVAAIFALIAPLLYPFPVIQSGYTFAIVLILHYEWIHFLSHTPYHAKTKWVRRLLQNHRLHHWKHEGYWHCITALYADKLLKTSPKPIDVQMSAVARQVQDRRRSPDAKESSADLTSLPEAPLSLFPKAGQRRRAA